jgi:hypothetical protein
VGVRARDGRALRRRHARARGSHPRARACVAPLLRWAQKAHARKLRPRAILELPYGYLQRQALVEWKLNSQVTTARRREMQSQMLATARKHSSAAAKFDAFHVWRDGTRYGLGLLDKEQRVRNLRQRTALRVWVQAAVAKLQRAAPERAAFEALNNLRRRQSLRFWRSDAALHAAFLHVGVLMRRTRIRVWLWKWAEFLDYVRSWQVSVEEQKRQLLRSKFHRALRRWRREAALRTFGRTAGVQLLHLRRRQVWKLWRRAAKVARQLRRVRTTVARITRQSFWRAWRRRTVSPKLHADSAASFKAALRKWKHGMLLRWFTIAHGRAAIKYGAKAARRLRLRRGLRALKGNRSRVPIALSAKQKQLMQKLGGEYAAMSKVKARLMVDVWSLSDTPP